MQYYDLKMNWRKVKPYINNKKVQRTLISDMNILFQSRWKKEFKEGDTPRQHESCCWEWEQKGWPNIKEPAFWQYTKFGACHWLVNFNLELAKLVLPDQPWQIIKSRKHSTVWNGKDLLFEFNLQAFGVSADVCFEEAYNYGRVLKPGRQRKCHKLEYYKDELEREKKQCEVDGTVFTTHG